MAGQLTTTLFLACSIGTVCSVRDGYVLSHHQSQRLHIPINADWVSDSNVDDNAGTPIPPLRPPAAPDAFQEAVTLRRDRSFSQKDWFYSLSRVYPRFKVLQRCTPVEGYLQNNPPILSPGPYLPGGDVDALRGFPRLLLTFYADSMCSVFTRSALIADDSANIDITLFLDRDVSMNTVSTPAQDTFPLDVLRRSYTISEDFLSVLSARLSGWCVAFLCIFVVAILSVWAAVRHACPRVFVVSAGDAEVFENAECRERRLPASSFGGLSNITSCNDLFSRKDTDTPFGAIIS